MTMIEDIEQPESVEHINIKQLEIDGIGALERFVNLRQLYAWSNKIKDLGPLAALTTTTA